MIIYYILASIGMCFIMKYGSILESFRQKTITWVPCLEKLYKCCLCMGFWAGVVTAPCLYIIETWDVVELVFYPFVTANICWFADSIMTLIHSQTNYFNSGLFISSSSSSGSTPNK
jgi:hypothetical protein